MPPKKRAPKGMAKPLPPGQILTDLRKKEWKLGELIGQGGFGYLYLGSDKVTNAVNNSAAYVIKVEPHSNGPLFVELAFYQRAAKQETISAWMKSHKQAHLGVPHYIGSGSFENGGIKYRFMVMDRFGQDVEKLFLDAGKKFPLQTVFSLGLRLLEALEYLHEQEYVHADIKASNLLTGFGEKNKNIVYLVDFGLAYRYCPSGQHVPYKEDPKRKHDGTIEFTSRDAHKGLAPSRRGDLEVLSYCMLQWLCGCLPWETNLNNKDFVMQEKMKFMKDVNSSLNSCFGQSPVPGQLAEFFRYINKLEYTEKPDYDRIKNWFRDALKKVGYSDDGKTVHFDVTANGKKARKTPADKESLVNGDAKKRKAAKSETTTDEETSPAKKRRSPAKESPKKKATVRKTTAAKKVKRLSNDNKGSNVRTSQKSSVSPNKRAPRKGVSPKTKTAQKPALSKAFAKMASLQETRRSVRRNKNAETVDFAQSP